MRRDFFEVRGWYGRMAVDDGGRDWEMRMTARALLIPHTCSATRFSRGTLKLEVSGFWNHRCMIEDHRVEMATLKAHKVCI